MNILVNFYFTQCALPPPSHSLFPLSHVPKVFGIIIKIDKIKNSPSKSIPISSIPLPRVHGKRRVFLSLFVIVVKNR